MPARPTLVKISEFARRSSVPPSTIKHYLREGLLAVAFRASKTMALYDLALVDRVKAIKELQRTHALPLKVIKRMLDESPGDRDDAAARAIRKTISRTNLRSESRTRAELVAAGMPVEALELFTAVGLITPRVVRDVERYQGEDLALLRVLGAARKAGLTAEMLPASSVEPYLHAIRELVRTELEMFRQGVLPRARKDLARLTEAATTLSEQLVILVRRKLLVPTLQQLVEEEQSRKRS